MPRSASTPAHLLAAREAELAACLARVAAGDQVALARFYDETSRLVFAVAFRLVGDRQRAEEVTLDVYLQVWHKAATFVAARGRASSWLLALARSRALDRVRRERAERRGDPRGLEGLELLADERAFDPFEAPLSDERCSLVAKALASLPREQRRAVELAYFKALSHVEIAGRLGEPLGTVKTRIRLGMLKLRDVLRPLESVT